LLKVGKIHGVRVCKRATCVSHLLLATDSLFLFSASIEEVREMKKIMETYVVSSGQALNYGKSFILRTKSLNDMLKESISAILGVCNDLGTEIYLGIPNLVGRRRNGCLDFLGTRFGSGCDRGFDASFLVEKEEEEISR
ncbi:hypothetical protein LINPERPRIM_LOCUS2767, partial [Linum perenne]